MNKITIKSRAEIGKKAKKLLLNNDVPAVIYSAKGESTPVTMSIKDADKMLLTATKTTIFDLDNDGKITKAVIKEIQRHSLKNTVQHVAFFKVDEEAEMVFEIPFEFTGVSLAVKNNLGTLQTVQQSIKVKCKVNNLVNNLVVDISKLERPGQTIKVSEIDIPKAIKLFHADDIDNTIVTITEFEKEEVKTDEAAATTATPEAAA